MLRFVAVLLAVLPVLLSAQEKYKTNLPYVVVLSMDAFRWDYPNLYHTTNLDSIAKVGVTVRSLQPCFPSKTFPNHFSMATGLYPENHGIVQNNFFDKELGEYRLGDREAVQNADFYGGEPIWVTAEKQNVRSACFYWPGSEAPVGGYYPSTWKKYDGSVSFEARADSVVAWLQKPSQKRPHLIMWYMHEPDGVGHDFGPESHETHEMVEYLDSIVGDFWHKVSELPHADSINLVFTADHGMGSISTEKAIQIDKYVKESWIKDIKGGNPVYMIDPVSAACADSVSLALARVSHLKCWPKNALPKRFHYGNNERIYDLVIAADPGWSIYWKSTKYGNGGTHGYDLAWRDMHAIFYAVGPAFKKGYLHPTIQNTNLYVLFAEILGLQPVKTDGNIGYVKGMLAEPHEH